MARLHRSLAGDGLVEGGVVDRAPGSSTPGGNGFVCAATNAPAPAHTANTPTHTTIFSPRRTGARLPAAVPHVIAEHEVSDVAVVDEEDPPAGPLGEPLHETGESVGLLQHEDVQRHVAAGEPDGLREGQPDRLRLRRPREEGMLALEVRGRLTVGDHDHLARR